MLLGLISRWMTNCWCAKPTAELRVLFPSTAEACVLAGRETGDVPDHRDFALWLGTKLDLNLEFLDQFAAKKAAESATSRSAEAS